MTKRIISLLLTALTVLSLFSFVSCNDEDDIATISFAKSTSIEEMKKLDGKKVAIIGYMSTLSPISGAFMYLLNLPYQSCPFCEPNSTTLSNTIAVYAPDGKKFEFTDRLIRVVGTLEFGEYTDEYGYNYSYLIKDATYTEVNTSEMGEHLMLWQNLASSGVIADVYAMYDYVNFVCFWGTYTAKFADGSDYLYPSDLQTFMFNDGAQFNYGYKEGYFDSLIARIEEVDQNAFKTLTDNIKKAKALASEALDAYNRSEYELVSEYSSSFNDGRSQYKMKNADEYKTTLEEIYREFAVWLGEWEV
jgi:hypothetical protein